MGPVALQMGTCTVLGVLEKLDKGPELSGKDGAASEKEGAAGEAADILTADRGVVEAVGMDKLAPGG